MAKNMDTATDGKVVDKFKNYKKGKQVTVPTSFQARSHSTPVKLAYITDDEAGILKALKPGVPHDGPMHIPNYNDYDPDRGYTSGAAMSAAEAGKHTSDTLASNLSNQDIKDIRSGAIAAGAGQVVNPSFFGPKNTVSKEELRAAKEFAPGAYKATRGSRFGLGSLLGGLLGFVNPILGLAYRGITSAPETFKTFKESSSLADFYNTMKSKREDEDDMSKYNQLGLYTDRLENPEYYNDLGNEFALGATSDPYRMSVGTTQGNTLQFPPLDNRITQSVTQGPYRNINDYLETNLTTDKGILNTDAFTNNRKDFNINNANLYQTTNDGQMYMDDEIFNRRY